MVLEDGVEALLRCQAAFECEIAAVKTKGVLGERIIDVGRREESAIAVRPGAELGEGSAEKTGVLAFDVELEFVIVLIGNGAAIQRQGGFLVEIGAVMEAFDSAKSAAGSLVLLLEVGRIAADKPAR